MDYGAGSDEADRAGNAAAHRDRGCGGTPGWSSEPGPAAPLTGTPSGKSEADGLCAFNIGLVPASVTPPRTWRQAAWFAVLSSAAVLAALLVAAALIGSPRSNNRIDALPGYPSAVPPIVPPPGGRGGRPTVEQPVRLAAGTETGTRDWPGGPGRVPGRIAGATDGSVAPTGEVRLLGDQPVAPPSASAGGASAAIDGATIYTETQRYYGSVVDDVRQAYAMTTGALRAAGLAALAERYRDVSAVRLASVTVDPAHGITSNLLEITGRDGAVRTERRQLVFVPGLAPGDDPKISDERPSWCAQR
jgi:hypothetical protein